MAAAAAAAFVLLLLLQPKPLVQRPRGGGGDSHKMVRAAAPHPLPNKTFASQGQIQQAVHKLHGYGNLRAQKSWISSWVL